MKAFLRTLWKDMVILRWWLLAWTAAVVGFAVWRDHLATQWDASSFDSKPDADTVQKVLLGFAAVIAVRLMHTDKLHGDYAFWRTRPTSALRLAFAKLVLGFHWLFLLPCAVEYVLFDHLEYGFGAWLATGDFALRLAGAVLPALAVATAIGSPSVAMALGLLLAASNMSFTPESWSANILEIFRPEFFSWVWRLLLCLIIVPFAATRRFGAVTILAVLCLLPGKAFEWIKLPVDAWRLTPAVIGLAPTPIALSFQHGQFPAYLHDLPNPERAMLLPAGEPARILHAGGNEQVSIPMRPATGGVFGETPFPGRFPVEADLAFLLHRPAKFRPSFFSLLPVKSIEENLGAGARIETTVQVFQRTNPLMIELPISPGAEWKHGSATIRLRGIEFAPENAGLRFDLETIWPYYSLLPRPGLLALQGTGPAPPPSWYLVNDKHRLAIPLTMQFAGPGLERGKFSRQQTISESRALNRRHGFESRYLDPSIYHIFRIAPHSALSAISPDCEILRGARLVILQWNVVHGPEQTVNWTVGKMATRPRPFGEIEYRALSSQEQVEWRADPPPPVLTDPADVERYIQDCISANVSSEEGHEVTVPRLAAIGPAHFPEVMRHLAIYQGYGSSGGEDENEVLLDKTALRLAQPEHLPVLLRLLELGISMHRTLAARPWFLEAALPRLESLAGNFAYSRDWVKSLASLKDPRVYPALVAWCRNGNDGDFVSPLRELAKLPAFPLEQAARQLQERCLRLGFTGKTSIGLALARWGDPAGPALAAEQFAQWPWPSPDNAATGPSFFGPYSQNLFPDLPEDVGKAIPWFATNGPKLRWTGTQWVLPPEK